MGSASSAISRSTISINAPATLRTNLSHTWTNQRRHGSSPWPQNSDARSVALLAPEAAMRLPLIIRESHQTVLRNDITSACDQQGISRGQLPETLALEPTWLHLCVACACVDDDDDLPLRSSPSPLQGVILILSKCMDSKTPSSDIVLGGGLAATLNLNFNFCFALIFALLCFALRCVALRCFALLCFALLCFALLCLALLRCVALHRIFFAGASDEPTFQSVSKISTNSKGPAMPKACVSAVRS